MSSNSASIINQLHHDFQELIDYVTGAGSQSHTAYEVELTLFRRVLALGAQLLRLFFVQCASVRPKEPVYAPDGTRLVYYDQRPRTYFSVVGKVRFRRPYFHIPGHEGVYPLDAALSLPARCYSDVLRDWAEYGAVDTSYDQSLQVLERILGLSLSKVALETSVQEDATDVESFYDQKASPSSHEEGSILVVQVDGKGVPMKRDKPAERSARPGKGHQRAKKKEAVVTAIYSIAPYLRTPQDVVEALLPELAQHQPDPQASDALPSRPVPVGKELRATWTERRWP